MEASPRAGLFRGRRLRRLAPAGHRSLPRLVRDLTLVAAALLALVALLRRPPRLEPAAEDRATADAVALPPACEAARAAAAVSLGTGAAGEWAARSRLYEALAADSAAKGFAGVSATGGTQGMSVATLFVWDAVTDLPAPRLQRLDVPVRAVVLPLPAASDAASRLAAATAAVLLPLCGPAGVWLQDPTAYHTSLFHASHHLAPVANSAPQEAREAAAVAAVFNATCPLHVVLERVAVTPGGVFIACWNILRGGQPATLRARLAGALPRAPSKQLVHDAPILHATLARVLRPPLGRQAGRDSAAALAAAADALSRRLCGMRAVLDAAWRVTEYDALALALQGAYEVHRVEMGCSEAPMSDERAALPPPPGGRALDAG